MDIFIVNQYKTSRKREHGERIYVTLSDGKKMARYRFVMMTMLDTNFIPNYMCVHHIDNNQTNDVPDNLILMTNLQHACLHANPNGTPYPERRKENLRKYNNSNKAKERVKKWKQENKEHMIEYRKKYKQDRLDKLLKYRRDYYLKNREKAIEYTREWRKINGRKKGDK